MGTVSFGRNGEWDTPRVLQVQFDRITGHGIDQFRSGATQLAVSPPGLAAANLRYPYAESMTQP
jgi:branched-chain amino acid transport system substrate-binding protein